MTPEERQPSGNDPDEVRALRSRIAELEATLAAVGPEADAKLPLIRFAIDRAGDAAFWMGADARFIYVNQAACRTLGYTHQELLQMSVHDIDPVFSEDVWSAHWAELRERGSFTLESQHRTKDGRILPVELRVNHMRFGGKEYNCAFARDISARKASEAALRQSEERLGLAMRGAQLGLWDWDLKTGRLVHDELWASMLGYSLAEIEPDLSTWESLVHPDDYPEVRRRLDAHLEGRTRIYESEHRLRRKDGEWIWIEDRGRVLERDADGRPLRAAGVHLDIGERKRAEEELARAEALLRAAIDQTPAGILIADAPDVRIRLSNAAAHEIRGECVEPLTGIPVELHTRSWQTLHPDGTPFPPEDLPLSRAVLEGITTRNVEVIIRRQDGEDRWVLANAAPIQDAEGNTQAGVVVFTDITERKKQEESQRTLEAKVREAQKLESLGVLAGGIAHDFNNLLMGMLGHADIARGKLTSHSALGSHLDEIVSAATQAADLCQQMLAYSGRGRFVVEDLDLPRLIREMGNLLEVSISKSAQLVYDFEPGIPNLRGDPTQIRQVVMNLILNASESLDPEGGVIRVETGSERLTDSMLDSLQGADDLESGSYVYIDVTDTGAGMDAETRGRIFDPFFTTKFAGRGLGLAAVLGIVRGHDGGIRVTSARGRGSSIRVYLPAVAARAVEPTPPEPASPDTVLSGVVLVVDDEPTVRGVTQLFLEDAGFRVLTAAGGEEALALYAEHVDEICAVVLDLTMPGMDGEQTFHRLRSIRGDLPVVLVSGYTEEELIERFPADAPDGFLQKPYTAGTLLSLVQNVLPASTGHPHS